MTNPSARERAERAWIQNRVQNIERVEYEILAAEASLKAKCDEEKAVATDAIRTSCLVKAAEAIRETRLAALEEAARIAEAWEHPPGEDNEHPVGATCCGYHVAAAIRKAKRP